MLVIVLYGNFYKTYERGFHVKVPQNCRQQFELTLSLNHHITSLCKSFDYITNFVFTAIG